MPIRCRGGWLIGETVRVVIAGGVLRVSHAGREVAVMTCIS